MLENERVRVLETRIPAGETTAVHTHRWPNVQHVLSSSEFVRRDDGGAILLDTRRTRPPEPGATLWSEALPPHSIENVGDQPLHVIMVELRG